MLTRRPSRTALSRVARVLGAAALVLSCGRDGPTGPAPVRVPAKLSVVSGNAQEGVVGQPLPQPVVARVTDASGEPVEGQIVNFRVVSGGGEVYAGAALTNADGIASERWTLGTLTSTPHRLEARAVSAAGDPLVFATFTAIPQADQPDTLVVVSGSGQTGPLGAALPESLVVEVRDQFGNAAPGVQVSWSAADDGVMSPAVATTDAQGRARSSWTLGAFDPGAQSAQASANGATATFTATATGTPATATVGVTSGNGQSQYVYQMFSQPLVVTVRDAQGQPMPSASVEWRVSAGSAGFMRGSAVIPDTTFTVTTMTTGANGTASISAGPGKRSGPITITATAGSSVATFSLSGLSGPACKNEVTVSPLSSPPSSTVNVVLRFLDLYNNLTQNAGTIPPANMAVSAGSIDLPQNSNTQQNYFWTLPSTPGTAAVSWDSYLCTGSSVTAITIGNTGRQSRSVTVTGPPTAANFVASSGNGQSGQVGTALANPLIVRATDASGNGVANVQVTWSVGTNDGSVSPTSGMTNAQGYAQTTWTLGTVAGARSISASVSNVSPVTFTATANPGPAAQLDKVAGDNQTGAPNAALPNPLTVRVRDSFGNPIAGAAVTFTVAGGGSVSPASGSTGATGQLSTTWTLGAAGTQQVSASTNGVPGITFDATIAQSPTLALGALAVGSSHACAIASDGRTFCWGRNSSGQLGDGTTQSPQPMPYATPTGFTFTSLAGGPLRTCGFTTTQSYCWGYGGNGALGDGIGLNRTRPSALVNGPYRQVAMGEHFMCAITSGGDAGSVRCGGTNSGNGELGDGRTSSHWTPELVAGNRAFRRIAAALGTACGIATDGVTYCWGNGAVGARGDGTFDAAGLSPAPITGGHSFVEISGGGGFFCALTGEGAAWCWGENTHGQLGDGSTANRAAPTPVATSLRFAGIVTGVDFACGVTASGTAHCWGRNNVGQLGNASTTNSVSPVPVSGGRTFVTLSTSNLAASACGVTTSGEAWCWGANNVGQLGDGTTLQRTAPVRVLTP